MEEDDRPMITLDKLFIGQKLYQADYSAEDGVEEIVVKDILMYTIVKEMITLGDSCYEEEVMVLTEDSEKCDYHGIGLDDDWETNPYEIFLTKQECQEYVLKELGKTVKENEEMISRWQATVSNHKAMLETISKELKYDN